MWNVTATLTAATGDACMKEAVQSVMDASSGYSISVTQTGDSATVTLKSASGSFGCSYPARSDSEGFTSEGVHGYYSCSPDLAVGFRCSNGTQVSLFTLGQDITGRIAGDEISGTWKVAWCDFNNDEWCLETTSQFSGRRQ